MKAKKGNGVTVRMKWAPAGLLPPHAALGLPPITGYLDPELDHEEGQKKDFADPRIIDIIIR